MSKGRAGIVAIAVCAVIAFLVGHQLDIWTLRIVAKPVPVLAMIGVLAASRPGTYGRLVLIGLVFSLGGDMLLEWSESTFLYGLISFLIGHLFYIGAYVSDERRPRLLLALPFAAWGVGIPMLLADSLGDMLVPVSVYAAVICTMMWRAAARLDLPNPRPDLVAAAVGAVLFALSDSMIAFNRFGDGFPGARYAIILLYWLGQLGITWSALRRPTD